MTNAVAKSSKHLTTPVINPRFYGENHSQASKREESWNKVVPIAVKVHCIAMNVHTFEHIMNDIDPVKMHTQLKQSTALIGVLNIILTAKGINSPDTISMLKKRYSSTRGDASYSAIWKYRYV